jgi:hypothetical protein
MLRAVTPCSLQSWKQLIDVSDEPTFICRIKKMKAVVSPKRQIISTSLHCVTFQQTVIVTVYELIR